LPGSDQSLGNLLGRLAGFAARASRITCALFPSGAAFLAIVPVLGTGVARGGTTAMVTAIATPGVTPPVEQSEKRGTPFALSQCDRLLKRPIQAASHGINEMSDAKGSFKKGVDAAADKTKEVGGKVVDKTKDAATAAGNKIKEAGQKLKDAGK